MRAGAAESLARREIALALASAFADPRSPRGRSAPLWATDTDMVEAVWRVAALATADLRTGELGLGEAAPAQTPARALAEWLRLDRDRRQELHQSVFGIVTSRECPPYETDYLHWNDPTYRATELADIAGFYAAFGLEPAREFPERHDHISSELEFLAFLLQKRELAANERGRPEHLETVESALRLFTSDHFVWWAPTFAQCVRRRIDHLTGGGASEALGDSNAQDLRAFADVAMLLRAWVAAHRVAVGVAPCRRIIAPRIDAPPPDVDDGCGQCAMIGEGEL